MLDVLLLAIGVLALALLHLGRGAGPGAPAGRRRRATRPVPASTCVAPSGWSAGVPGLVALIAFSCFNNFLGGAFMALMDAYGLSLVSVQAWGLLWGVLSAGVIVGGLLVARIGLGSQPGAYPAAGQPRAVDGHRAVPAAQSRSCCCRRDGGRSC